MFVCWCHCGLYQVPNCWGRRLCVAWWYCTAWRIIECSLLYISVQSCTCSCVFPVVTFFLLFLRIWFPFLRVLFILSRAWTDSEVLLIWSCSADSHSMAHDLLLRLRCHQLIRSWMTWIVDTLLNLLECSKTNVRNIDAVCRLFLSEILVSLETLLGILNWIAWVLWRAQSCHRFHRNSCRGSLRLRQKQRACSWSERKIYWRCLLKCFYTLLQWLEPALRHGATSFPSSSDSFFLIASGRTNDSSGWTIGLAFF